MDNNLQNDDNLTKNTKGNIDSKDNSLQNEKNVEKSTNGNQANGDVSTENGANVEKGEAVQKAVEGDSNGATDEEAPKAESVDRKFSDKTVNEKAPKPKETDRTSGDKTVNEKTVMKRKGKFYKTLQSGTLAACFLAAVILLNVIVSILCERYPSLNLDLTTSHVNTLSAEAAKVVESVKQPTTIYIMASEETAKGDTLLSEYGIKYSQVSALAKKIAEKNQNIKVQYVDLDKNPTFASEYKNDGLTTADVLVKTEKRYRVLAYTDLFDVQQSQTDGSTTAYSKVDSALASAISSVTADNLPIAAFETGHNEMLETTLYKSLLTSNQFETKDVNLLTDSIPKNTQLLVLATPSTDYTPEEIKKLDAFLSNQSQAADRSLLVTFHPSQQTMPNLTAFLNEWGLNVKTAEVLESSQSNYYSDPSSIFATAGQGVSLGTNNSYQYLLMPQCSAIERLFNFRGDITTYDLATSSATSYLYNVTTEKEEKSNQGTNTLAALAQKKVTAGGKDYKSNVIVMGSSYMFLDGIINADTFADRAYLLDLSKYAAGVSGSLNIVESKSVETTTSDITMNAAASTLLGLGVFTILIPFTIGIIGIIVYTRRRRR